MSMTPRARAPPPPEVYSLLLPAIGELHPGIFPPPACNWLTAPWYIPSSRLRLANCTLVYSLLLPAIGELHP
eukprot:1164904-Prorocentrum_minimum.AAC.1